MTARRNDSERNETLTERQEAVAAALAIGRTVAAAARECKVGLSTIWTWKKTQPAFNARVVELQDDLVGGTIGRLAKLMQGEAMDALENRLKAKDPKTKKPTVTLDDIKAVFDLFTNVTSHAELKARLEALEANQTRKGRR